MVRKKNDGKRVLIYLKWCYTLVTNKNHARPLPARRAGPLQMVLGAMLFGAGSARGTLELPNIEVDDSI